MLSTLFFRDQTAYVVGRVVNGMHDDPFAVALKHAPDGRLYVDALLMDDIELALLFSANRSYFLVDMEVPSAYVDFLRAMLPDKTASELYTMVGPAEGTARTLFYRDFLHHLAHSRDRFIVAPGHPRPRDERVHAAVVSVRVQGDQGPDRRDQGHRRARASSRSTRW